MVPDDEKWVRPQHELHSVEPLPVPDPELMIRTSGEHRISNFMLWQLAYAEFHFTSVLWPDFRREHFFEAIRDFQNRERRFGAVPNLPQT